MRDHPLYAAACNSSDDVLRVTAAVAAERRDELAAEGRVFLAGVFHELAMVCAAVRDERRAMNRRMEDATVEALGIRILPDVPTI